MKSLILAEKPSVARDIAKALNINHTHKGHIENSKYVVTWALGHLVTNATPEEYDQKFQRWHLDDLPIIPKYMKTKVIGKTRKQFNTVQRLMQRKDVKDIIIATDAGREGELVARLIIEKAHVKKPIKRLWVSSVTKKAILDGFKHLKDGRKFNNLYQAALARSEADWIVGINATRALTTKYDAQLSLGRVQTPTIQLVASRQHEIKQFKPKDYYTLSIKATNLTFNYEHKARIFDKEKLEKIAQQLKHQQAKVIEVKEKHKKSYPGQLYNLTDLQQAAYQRYHLGAKQTLNALQQLYERHKLVTYPRTDSQYLTSDMVSTLKERIQATMATEFKEEARDLLNRTFSTKAKYVNDGKVSDHHAIIPTEVRPKLDTLSNTEQKVYALVVQRFLEALSSPYEYKEKTIILKVNDETFKHKVEEPVALGHKVFQHGTAKVQSVSTPQKGATLNIEEVSIHNHQTTPPPYFNEGTLLKAMERPDKEIQLNDQRSAKTLQQTGGIGTVATRADIIEKLFNMNALESRNGKIKVTSKGQQILELAPESLTSPLLTAQWEDKLLKIEKGQYQRQQFINEMKQFTHEIIQQIKESEEKYKHDNLTTAQCPTCGKFMLKVNKKNSSMLVCQDPSCKTKKDVQKKTNARCPKCKKKLTKFGTGKNAVYRCVCGYTESQKQMDERFKNKGKDKVSKKDMNKYMKEDSLDNNPFKDALKGLKL